MSTSSVDPQLRKIWTQLHPKDSKKCPELYLYAKESQSYAQYSLETKSKPLQENHEAVCVYITDCQDRSYGSSRLTGINWSRYAPRCGTHATLPEDGLGMTPTAEILTQLVQNSRVTTNAINQLALVQQEATASASASTSGSYEGMLSKALEGAVKMLGRPPLFGGGKTEVYDFMDFKEQLYNILAYAEPKYTLSGTWRDLETMRAYPTALRTMSTKLCRRSCIPC